MMVEVGVLWDKIWTPEVKIFLFWPRERKATISRFASQFVLFALQNIKNIFLIDSEDCLEEKVRITPLDYRGRLIYHPKLKYRIFHTLNLQNRTNYPPAPNRNGFGPTWHTCGASVAFQSEKK